MAERVFYDAFGRKQIWMDLTDKIGSIPGAKYIAGDSPFGDNSFLFESENGACYVRVSSTKPLAVIPSIVSFHSFDSEEVVEDTKNLVDHALDKPMQTGRQIA